MKCPKCENDTFVELDSDAVDNMGQCKLTGGCGFRETVDYVRGYWDGYKEKEKVLDKVFQVLKEISK